MGRGKKKKKKSKGLRQRKKTPLVDDPDETHSISTTETEQPVCAPITGGGGGVALEQKNPLTPVSRGDAGKGFTGKLAAFADRSGPSDPDHVRALEKAIQMKDDTYLREVSHIGFATDSLRRRVWPLLLRVDPALALQNYSKVPLTKHKYTDQVAKDINRSLFHFDVTKLYEDAHRERMRERLSNMINKIFSANADLHYVQGFHDIVSVFLIVCGEPLGYALSERLARIHIRDSLRPDLGTVVQLLSVIFPLLKLVDPEAHSFLEKTEVQSVFTLSWVLTWFSHNIERFEDVKRIFDFLLASHPSMPAYLAAALIVKLRSGLLALPCEFAAVHEYFQSLPEEIDFGELMLAARNFYKQHSPQRLYAQARVTLPEDSSLNCLDVVELVDFLNGGKPGRQRRVPFCVAAVGAAVLGVAVLWGIHSIVHGSAGAGSL